MKPVLCSDGQPPPAPAGREKVGFANYCLADFVAPKLSGKADCIGNFAVTGGLEEARAGGRLRSATHDDYNRSWWRLPETVWRKRLPVSA